MADVLVTCINKSDRDNRHESITHLGGASWRWTRQQVVDSINAGTNTFHTNNDGRRAYLVVMNGPYGQYVQTKRDDSLTNNLLSLTECHI